MNSSSCESSPSCCQELRSTLCKLSTLQPISFRERDNRHYPLAVTHFRMDICTFVDNGDDRGGWNVYYQFLVERCRTGFSNSRFLGICLRAAWPPRVENTV